jgi:hypothetical protein
MTTSGKGNRAAAGEADWRAKGQAWQELFKVTYFHMEDAH